MANWKYMRTLSDNLRHGTKAQRAALLEWVNQPQFKNRKPTPEELTKECLRQDSPLYGLMKTEVKDAAATYWRQTAQDILRHIDVVRVNIKTSKVLTKPVKAWVPIKTEHAGRISEENYVPTQRIMGSPSLKRSVLEAAHADFVAWMQRYERYVEFAQEFSPVLEAYKHMQQQLEAVA